MEIKKINRIEILNELGMQLGDISLKFSVEIDQNNIIASNFEVVGIDDETLIIQFFGEDRAYDLYDVDEITAEFVESIKIETENENIIDDDIYEEIYKAFCNILIPIL